MYIPGYPEVLSAFANYIEFKKQYIGVFYYREFWGYPFFEKKKTKYNHTLFIYFNYKLM